jgi:hypothetical protein
MFNKFFFKKCAVYEVNEEKYCTAGEATDDNIIQNIHNVCWTTKATNTHSEYVILFAFPLKNGCMNAPQCYIVLILPVLLTSSVVSIADVNLLA